MKLKKEKIAHYNSLAAKKDKCRRKNDYYHEKIVSLLGFHIPENVSVLDIGCGTGSLFAAFKPSKGVGVDFAEEMIKKTKTKYDPAEYPELNFQEGDVEELKIDDVFEYIDISDVVGDLNDAWKAFRKIRTVSDENSRIVINYYNAFWEPILTIAEKLGLKMPQLHQNWQAAGDIKNLHDLNGFEVIKEGQ